MSFAYEAKLEVLKQDITNDCCAIAFLSAVIKCSGQLNITNKNYVVEIFTEIEELYPKINAIIKQYYGYECDLEISDDNATISKNTRYRITLPSEVTEQLLVDLGIVSLNEEGCKTINNGIPNFLIADDCCKKSYIKGAFVSCATSNIVIKNYDNKHRNNSSGYHLEFVFNFENLADDFVKLLEIFNIPSKVTIRKNSPIVYIKEYQLICDMLALVGASHAVLTLQNEAAIREVRNNVNRQTNCFNANLNKTVGAAVKQMKAIKIIQDNMGLENLDEPLMELCLIRLANPDESLETLRKLYSYNISKSGINHRLEKIVKIADEIQKNRFKINTL